jgi:hypothetical protein
VCELPGFRSLIIKEPRARVWGQKLAGAAPLSAGLPREISKFTEESILQYLSASMTNHRHELQRLPEVPKMKSKSNPERSQNQRSLKNEIAEHTNICFALITHRYSAEVTFSSPKQSKRRSATHSPLSTPKITGRKGNP